MFTPGRLSLARRRRRLSKAKLAEMLGITPHTVLRYESGDITPPEEMIMKLSELLDFPIEFFEGDEIDGPSERAVSFRSLSTMSARDRRSALAAGSLAFMFSDWVEQKFALPEPALSDLSEIDPELAARSLRQRWSLGERPVNNVIHLLEAKGVRVFSLAENTKTIDACSAWRGDYPFMFLNMFKTAERTRFDAAHELGHLVLHRHGGPRGREVEEHANRFAEEFLMPAADVLAVAPRISKLNQIIQAKKRWGVSAQALTYRLHRLKVTTEWQNRMFCIQLVQHGYTDAEPQGMAREQSLIWQKVLTELWKERITKTEIAAALHLPQWELENLLFGLAGLPDDGSGEPKRGTGLKVVVS
jgi:Zn-dependent peptidase ImmA (M78 family)/DNA-binding XRE family transcriptional regulator